MSENKFNKRYPMAADTDPTDEELELVIREALDLTNTCAIKGSDSIDSDLSTLYMPSTFCRHPYPSYRLYGLIVHQSSV